MPDSDPTRQMADHARHMMAALRGGHEIVIEPFCIGETWWKVPPELVPEVGNMLVRVA